MKEQGIIRLNYTISPKGKEELCSIYFNGEGGIISAKGKSKGMSKVTLSKLDRILLERKSSLAKLSVGTFKLKSDVVESLSTVGGHYIEYKKVQTHYRKD